MIKRSKALDLQQIDLWVNQYGRRNRLRWPKDSGKHLAHRRGWQGIGNEVSEFLHQFINSFYFCLHHPSASLSSTSPLSLCHPTPPLLSFLTFPFPSSPSHLNICLALWWVPSCLTVSPMKRPTICSVVHNTLETARTYGWERVRERERFYRPDECLYLPSGTQTGPQFTHLRCQQCKPPTKVVYVTWKISKQVKHFEPQTTAFPLVTNSHTRLV